MFIKLMFSCSLIHFCMKYQILKIRTCTSPTLQRWGTKRNQIMKDAKVQSGETISDTLHGEEQRQREA